MSKTVILLGRFVAVANYLSTVILGHCPVCDVYNAHEVWKLDPISFLIKFVIIIVTQFNILQLYVLTMVMINRENFKN